MFDISNLWAVAVAAMVLACPLMMVGMMAMAAFPFSRRLLGKQGSHMMCHGMPHSPTSEEERQGVSQV